MAAKNVTVIPATISQRTRKNTEARTRRRVAGYARVSTDSDEQFTSYEAQVDYYTQYIKNNPEWEFVKVYTDEGISGTNTKKREGFNQMVADAVSGKIDLIITKSVSRFARNTVDSLTTIRKLKEKGVEVFFEKENIWTFDSKGELLLTIMSSLAQEESRSISENITWGKRKQFADGKVSLPYKQFLGYRKGANGLPEIVPEEAEIVRLIYRMFMEGKSQSYIARYLMDNNFPSPSGKKTWQVSTVESILTNEKYKGDALLQKCFTVDFLTKKTKVNEGEVPQYYVENSHPAIISADVFEMVQVEIRRRKESPTRHSGVGIFASRIVCGDCGAAFGSKVWHSTDKYRKVVYQCNHKFSGEKKCTTPTFEEEQIKSMFVIAVNRLIENKAEIIRNYEEMRDLIFDTSALETERDALNEELTVVAELIQKVVDENARTAQNQDKYREKYDSLVARFEKAKERIAEIARLKSDKESRRLQADSFMKELKKLDSLVTEFDEKLWYTLVDCIMVYSKEDIRFVFRDGAEIKI